MDFPTPKNITLNENPISQSQLKNAKLFTNRYNALSLLPKKISFLEVGVLAGDYSLTVLNNKKIKYMYLIDTFNQKDQEMFYDRFTEKTHIFYVKNRFKKYKNIHILNGKSSNMMTLINKKFDYIYLDASHEYVDIEQDLESAVSILSKNGIIGINDYLIRNTLNCEEYGVVAAVNKFLYKNKNFEVVGFAFNNLMFSDIYIKRKI